MSQCLQLKNNRKQAQSTPARGKHIQWTEDSMIGSTLGPIFLLLFSRPNRHTVIFYLDTTVIFYLDTIWLTWLEFGLIQALYIFQCCNFCLDF